MSREHTSFGGLLQVSIGPHAREAEDGGVDHGGPCFAVDFRDGEEALEVSLWEGSSWSADSTERKAGESQFSGLTGARTDVTALVFLRIGRRAMAAMVGLGEGGGREKEGILKRKGRVESGVGVFVGHQSSGGMETLRPKVGWPIFWRGKLFGVPLALPHCGVDCATARAKASPLFCTLDPENWVGRGGRQ